MAYDNSYTAVTGGSLSAAQWNTHVRDNFTAVWAYTTAGDMVYATSSEALARLAPPAADSILSYDFSLASPSWITASPENALKFLRQKSTGEGFEWAGGGIKIAKKSRSSLYTYGGTWRDVPASDVIVTVDVTSTIIVYGILVGYNPTNGRGFQVLVEIDGAEYSVGTLENASDVKETAPLIGYKEGVAPGSITVKLREAHEFLDTYTVLRWSYIVLAIPE